MSKDILIVESYSDLQSIEKNNPELTDLDLILLLGNFPAEVVNDKF